MGRASVVCFVSLLIHRAIHTSLWTSQTSADHEQGAWSATGARSLVKRCAHFIDPLLVNAQYGIAYFLSTQNNPYFSKISFSKLIPLTMNPGVPSQYLSSLFNLSAESAREPRPHFLCALSRLVILPSLIRTLFYKLAIYSNYHGNTDSQTNSANQNEDFHCSCHWIASCHYKTIFLNKSEPRGYLQQ